MKSKLKLSSRTKVRLSPEEINELVEYTEFDRCAYKNIKDNTGIYRDTIVDTMSRGWMMLSDATKIRDFFKKMREEGIFSATTQTQSV